MPHFTTAQRLHSKPEFDAVYQGGAKLSDSCFLVLYRPNSLNTARLGLSIAARAAGNAVNRNRIKRVIRDSFRLHCATFPAVDIVVNARAGVRHADNAQLRERLARHWQNLVKRCGAL